MCENYDVIIDDFTQIIETTRIYSFDSVYEDLKEFHGSSSKEFSLLSSIKPNLINIYQEEKGTRGNLRGAILELFTFNVMLEKYECHTINCDHFEMDCILDINGIKSTKTVDVYASNLTIQKAECYECKINIFNLDEEDIVHLNEIYDISNGLVSPRIISFSYSQTINQKFLELNKDKKNIIVFGRESFEKKDFFALSCN